MDYQPTQTELEQLLSFLALDSDQALQRQTQGWFLRTDPFTGEQAQSYVYPNRVTPFTTSFLLAFLRTSLDLAERATEEYDSAGIPLITDKSMVPQLLLDISQARDLLVPMEKENAVAIKKAPDTITGPGDTWQKQVMLPLFFGQYPDGRDTYPLFMEGRILTKTANVGTEAVTDATSQLWTDLATRAGAAAGGAAAIAGAVKVAYILGGAFVVSRILKD